MHADNFIFPYPVGIDVWRVYTSLLNLQDISKRRSQIKVKSNTSKYYKSSMSYNAEIISKLGHNASHAYKRLMSNVPVITDTQIHIISPETIKPQDLEKLARCRREF